MNSVLKILGTAAIAVVAVGLLNRTKMGRTTVLATEKAA